VSFSKSFKIAFVIAFVMAFFGVAVGFERVVLDVLALGGGALGGYSGAMAFRRWRGDFRK
jgi:hypothetical protein